MGRRSLAAEPAAQARSGRRWRHRPSTRFALLAYPGAAFVVLFVLLPIVAIVLISLWRTERYVLYPDWNIENYRVLITEPTYWVFLFRSLTTATLVALACLVYSWPVAYFIARFGGRYRLLLVVALAAPFFTGVVLRVAALQTILGPLGLVNMGLIELGLEPIEVLMYTRVAAGIGTAYLFVPFMVTAIYLSLVNFNFDLLEVAKVNGARPWRAFREITWPLNWIGTVIGLVLVFIPALAESVTHRFLGGPNGATFGMILGNQFGETGTWALGSAMGVVLFAVSLIVLATLARTVNLRRSGFTGAGR
jgi:ABC-type spermidine/putrescine transport system permease subunit I